MVRSFKELLFTVVIIVVVVATVAVVVAPYLGWIALGFGVIIGAGVIFFTVKFFRHYFGR